MARITTVNRSTQDYGCGRCGDPIPKGSQYRWAKPGFRSRGKLIRCMKPECSFRQSELTTSNKSIAYAAQESGTDDLDAWDRETFEDLEAIRDAVVEGATECLEQYQSAQDAWGESSGGAENEEWAEYIGSLEAWIDELEGLDLEEFDVDQATQDARSDAEDDREEDAEWDETTDLEDLPEDVLARIHDAVEDARETWAEEQAGLLADAIDGLGL